MPGEELEDGLLAAQKLHALGIGSILTNLGENVTREEDAEEVTRHYVGALDRIAASGINAHISVKLTQLGLDIGAELCYEKLARLVQCADRHGNVVWIDMESSPYVDRTIALFRRAGSEITKCGPVLTGISVSHGERPRRVVAARADHPPRQRRLQRAAPRCVR